MIKPRSMLAGLVIVLALYGCGTRGGVSDDAARQAASRHGGSRAGQYGIDGAGSGVGLGGTGGDLDSATGPLSQRVIYFDYDSDDVLPEYRPVVAAHAEYLATHGGQTAVLEGHADERGSSEYNIALGERRGKAVERTMRLQGVGEGQLRVVSFGEEKPAVSGHDETAWQANRRVEIIYPGH